MRWLRVWIATVAMAAAVGPSAVAATARATPNTLEEVVGRARPGDTITLAPGEYRDIHIAKRHFDPAIILDASHAVLIGLHVSDSDGISIRGGEFRLPPPVTSPRTGEPAYGLA